MGCICNIITVYVYTNLLKHKYNKKTCCIKIVPTDSFTCETHQGTKQLKKAILFTLKEIKYEKIKS